MSTDNKDWYFFSPGLTNKRDSGDGLAATGSGTDLNRTHVTKKDDFEMWSDVDDVFVVSLPSLKLIIQPFWPSGIEWKAAKSLRAFYFAE